MKILWKMEHLLKEQMLHFPLYFYIHDISKASKALLRSNGLKEFCFHGISSEFSMCWFICSTGSFIYNDELTQCVRGKTMITL